MAAKNRLYLELCNDAAVAYQVIGKEVHLCIIVIVLVVYTLRSYNNHCLRQFCCLLLSNSGCDANSKVVDSSDISAGSIIFGLI